ncbi:MAG: hypothetical protein HAW66_11015 [Shewanella sp.]|nr:hypothetical protein [Shewanella sp.]
MIDFLATQTPSESNRESDVHEIKVLGDDSASPTSDNSNSPQENDLNYPAPVVPKPINLRPVSTKTLTDDLKSDSGIGSSDEDNSPLTKHRTLPNQVVNTESPTKP